MTFLFQFTLGPAYNELVITSNRIQKAKNLVSSGHHLIDRNVKKFGYNEHPATTSTFSCIKVLVVSGTQCICITDNNKRTSQTLLELLEQQKS